MILLVLNCFINKLPICSYRVVEMEVPRGTVMLRNPKARQDEALREFTFDAVYDWKYVNLLPQIHVTPPPSILVSGSSNFFLTVKGEYNSFNYILNDIQFMDSNCDFDSLSLELETCQIFFFVSFFFIFYFWEGSGPCKTKS